MISQGKTIAFHTLGCKVNQYETQALRERFADRGYTVVPETEGADVCVINTCTVTSLSDRKSRQFIRRARRLNPDGIVAVIGCYAQMKPRETAAMPEVDIVLGSAEKERLPELVAAFERDGRKRAELRPFGADFGPRAGVAGMDSRTRAYIKIQDGCDRRCAYCVIPRARGPARSRPADDIVAEARVLLENGYKELVLTGVNAALYGAEAESASERGVHTIVARLCALEGDFRVRLGSLEPTVIDARYVTRLFACEKLCPSLHLSVQSGSSRVLAAMRRAYSREDYLELVRTLRSRDPAYGVGTDIIAGFPGETEEDFNDSLRLLEEVDFSHVHVFRFSARAGTAAAAMPGRVPSDVKAARAEKLLRAGERSAAAFLRRNAGAVRSVLPERTDAETGLVEGLTENGIRVLFADEAPPGGGLASGGFVRVRLTTPEGNGMRGERL
ncbi:MAG: tRNA (N(6)-L-threonylcarbamoyladenosine(37)-C(2))-methylthiotransferase MtaB [Clostridiales Family XIII bacterium]|jgi:threonylcarbamoyladenosine tRNA methylthiotransferase MtaB|nr:tRNA (N(6)-L-threonylcarbamoyladenosine(37)-C(2))-methylthiotransferase MtaB [Clostridiales Family XIII bacterium]